MLTTFKQATRIYLSKSFIYKTPIMYYYLKCRTTKLFRISIFIEHQIHLGHGVIYKFIFYQIQSIVYIICPRKTDRNAVALQCSATFRQPGLSIVDQSKKSFEWSDWSNRWLEKEEEENKNFHLLIKNIAQLTYNLSNATCFLVFIATL
jgi:hypothetical protein